MLANRLKSLLDGLISETQSAFVPGRLITDNIMVAFEAHHYLKRKTQGKERYATLKLDMSKAYDRVEWNFLYALMLKLEFSRRWVHLIKECVSSVEYHILDEEGEIGPIIPQRGLRQGEPLSRYLFLLVVEGLSSLIRSQEIRGTVNGIAVSRGAPRVSHLFLCR